MHCLSYGHTTTVDAWTVDGSIGREYLIVDDGSSEIERAIMRKRFPYCKLIAVGRGHPESIRLILEQLGV